MAKCEKCGPRLLGPDERGDFRCAVCQTVTHMAIDGRELKREDYPELYRVIGEQYGSSAGVQSADDNQGGEPT